MKVACFGDVNVDVMATVPELPELGGESFAVGSHVGLGGSATNTAFVLSRLGIEAMVLAQVGDDTFGEYARTQMTDAGIDTSRVEVSTTATTGINLISVTPGGERTMIAVRGSNPGFGGGSGWLDHVDWLHISGYVFLAEPQRSAARAAIRSAADRDTPVSVDVPSEVAAMLGSNLLQDLVGIQLVSIGAPGLELMGGHHRIQEVEMVAVTAGAAECRLVEGGGEVTVAPPQVRPVDTTGAGDAFVAGLVASAGLGGGPMLVVASILGAAATTHQGAGAALGDVEAMEIAYRTGPWTDVPPAWLEAAERFLGLGR